MIFSIFSVHLNLYRFGRDMRLQKHIYEIMIMRVSECLMLVTVSCSIQNWFPILYFNSALFN